MLIEKKSHKNIKSVVTYSQKYSKTKNFEQKILLVHAQTTSSKRNKWIKVKKEKSTKS